MQSSNIFMFPYIIYHGNTTLTSQEQYRKITYHGNRKNRRGKKGLYMKRRSNSSRSFCNDSKYSFFFLLAFDHRSCFIVNRLRNKTHTNHIKLIKEVSSYPGRLLNLEEKALAKDMYCANVADGVMSNVIFEKNRPTVVSTEHESSDQFI